MSSNIDSYIIRLNENSNEKGCITFFHYKNINTIIISSLNAHEQGKGYGSLLLLLIICFIIDNIDNSYHIKSIGLDDCSDFVLTQRSIYLKFDYRHSINSAGNMKIIFFQSKPSKKNYIYNNTNPEPPIVYHKTLIDYYNSLLDKYIDMLIALNGRDISFTLQKNNENVSNFTENYKECLKKKSPPTHNLRPRRSSISTFSETRSIIRKTR